MNEECPNCGAKFSVTVLGGGGICGACQEPIDCPYCHKTVRKERTTGAFIATLIKAPDTLLSQHFNISDVEWEEMGAELNANTGNNDGMTYSYWFIVPDNTSEEILEKTGWQVGQMVDEIPIELVDNDRTFCDY
jgi:hypothetical protein